MSDIWFLFRSIGAHAVMALLLILPMSSRASSQDGPGEFRGISLGTRVLDYLPVDIDADGIGEIAIHTRIPAVRYSAYMAQKDVEAYGVYSPALGSWLARPTPLGDGVLAWTVLDPGLAGHAEFLFADSAGIHSFDANTGLRQDLWSFPSTPEYVYFWGKGPDGHPLVALNRQFEYSYHEQPPRLYNLYTSYWTVDVYDAVSGHLVQSQLSGPPPCFVMPTVALRDQSYLAFDQKYYKAEQSDMGGQEEQHDTLLVFDDEWQPIVKCPYPDAVAYPFNSLNRPVSHVIGARSERNDLLTVSWFTGNRGWVKRAIYAHLNGELAWTSSIGSRQFAGAALYDILNRGTVDCILVPEDGNDWEILDGATGELIEPLPHMPTVALTTQSLFTHGVCDLYYISRDSLYVWEPTSERPENVSFGRPAASVEPIDIDHDGISELAIRTAEVPARCGVYSPRAGAWRDGPYEIPVEGSAWGVVNLADKLEYVYLREDSLRLFDPMTATDTTIRVLNDPVLDLFVWGNSPDGEPTVGLLTEHAWSGPGFSRGLDWSWSIEELLSGDILASVPGCAESRPQIFRSSHGEEVCIYASTLGEMNNPGSSSISGSYGQMLRTYDSTWNLRSECQLPSYSINYASFGRGGWQLHALDVVHDPATDDVCAAWEVQDLGRGPALPQYFGQSRLMTAPARTEWSSQYSAGDPAWMLEPPHVGIAIYDMDRDGVSEMVLSLVSGAGWEIRDLYTGAVVDTVHDQPGVDLHTAALMSPGVEDLYYTSADTLYFWQPDIVTALSEKTGDQWGRSAIPSSFTLQAYPNPFNSSVRLTWPAQDQSARIEILNVLGQRVRRFDLAEGLSTLEWNARNDAGQQVPSGVYFARLVGQKATVTVKLVLLK